MKLAPCAIICISISATNVRRTRVVQKGRERGTRTSCTGHSLATQPCYFDARRGGGINCPADLHLSWDLESFVNESSRKVLFERNAPPESEMLNRSLPGDTAFPDLLLMKRPLIHPIKT